MNAVLMLGLLIGSVACPYPGIWTPLNNLPRWQVSLIKLAAGPSHRIRLLQGPEHHSIGPGWCGGPGVLIVAGGRDLVEGGREELVEF